MSRMYQKYSVLMSVYHKDNPAWLTESIDSMLAQTAKPDEFVVVKDGKLTPTLDGVIAEYCKKHPKLFKIVELERNVGLGLALAEGIKACKNKLIARMDADDYSVPDRLEKQLKIFAENPAISLVGSNVNEFTISKTRPICLVKLPETQDEIIKFAKKRCPFRHPSLLYKKDAIVTAGNYRNFPLYEDYDIYNRILKSGAKCYNIQESLVYMRVNPDFYQRRGGLQYLKKTLRFKNHSLKEGYYNFGEYLVATVPHAIVCIMPNWTRKLIYQKFLRKGVKHA